MVLHSMAVNSNHTRPVVGLHTRRVSTLLPLGDHWVCKAWEWHTCVWQDLWHTCVWQDLSATGPY